MNCYSTHLFRSESSDPAFNLSLEEVLMRGRMNDDKFIMLWQNRETVVVGRYQNVIEEVDVSYAESERIDIVRRNSGGGAVFHDKGNINISFIGSTNEASFELSCTEVVLDIIRRLGIIAHRKGRNDIFIGDCKVSGWAKYILGDTILFHGTLLVDSNLTKMRRVLTRNNKVSDSSAVQSNKSKVGNLSEYMSSFISTIDFMDKIEHLLCRRYNIQSDTLTDRQLTSASEGMTKYRSREWTFGYCPEFNYTISKHFASGTVKISLLIQEGLIKCVSFSGDFFSHTDVRDMEKDIERCVSYTDIRNALSRYGDSEIIDGVSNDELSEMFKEALMRWE